MNKFNKAAARLFLKRQPSFSIGYGVRATEHLRDAVDALDEADKEIKRLREENAALTTFHESFTAQLRTQSREADAEWQGI